MADITVIYKTADSCPPRLYFLRKGAKKEDGLYNFCTLPSVSFLFLISLVIYASLDFASSASFAKPSASLIAISDRTLRFKVTPACFKPYMNLL